MPKSPEHSQEYLFSLNSLRPKGRLGLLGMNLALSALILATSIPASSRYASAQEVPPSEAPAQLDGETVKDPTASTESPNPSEDSSWEEVFRLPAPLVSEGVLGSFPFAFKPILIPMVDSQGRTIRVTSAMSLSAINDGRQDRVVGGQFMGNGSPPNNPDFSRSVWGNSQREEGGPRGWHVRQFYGNKGERAFIQTISDEDKQNIKLDIRLKPDGITGTVAEFGTPDDQRQPFQMVRPLLDSAKSKATRGYSCT